jgi:hypothetical protein
MYENKAHRRTCGLRYIPREAIRAQRERGMGEPPHCSCIKHIPSLVRFERLMAERNGEAHKRGSVPK